MPRTIRVLTPDQATAFFRRFFGEEKVRRYVFGINEYAESVAKICNVDGFIDDFSKAATYMGKPVCKLGSVAPDSLVISCVTASSPVSALANLQKAGIRHFADYFALADVGGGRLPQVSAIAETRDDYREHAAEYLWVRQRLCDETSRDILDRLMNFRLSGNLQPMSVFEYAADRQYFEPFLGLRPGEVFVDGGGFDGFTSKEFASRCPDYKAIHLFEPSERMLATARINLADLARVTYHPLGLYDRAATLSFDANGGSASRITENGTETIAVDRLDDTVNEAVSFIKMDLEGAEQAALRGAKKHILADHPKLAVAVYHRPEDFWKIPKYILGLREDYKLYLRHYTEGWTETVMFFIPDTQVSL
jgi:FkbM family methyltransferase